MSKNENALIAIETLDVTVVFSEVGMTKLLEEIETKAMAHVPDISTEQGRDDISSLAYKVARSKTLIDNLGKDVVSDWKKKAKAIDAHRKIARDFLDNLKDKVRWLLTDWEAEQAVIKTEEERIEKEKIQGRVNSLFAVNVVLPFSDVACITDDEYELKLDAGRAELERIRREQEYQDEIKRLEEEDLAEKRAEIERVEKEQAEKASIQAQKEKALQVERDAIETEKRAEKERKDREAFEKEAAKNARIKAEADAKAKVIADVLKEKERIDREAREKKEREEAEVAEKARQESLWPDKDKIIKYAEAIASIVAPEVKDEMVYKIVEETEYELSEIAQNLIKRAKEL